MYTETILHGIPAAPGYAYGPIVIFPFKDDSIAKISVFTSEEEEIEKYRYAVAKLLDHFELLSRRANLSDDSMTAELMESYREMISDEELESDVVTKIREDRSSATEAVCSVFGEIIEDMESLEDEYARQRSDDIRSIRHQLLKILSGENLDTEIEIPDGGAILFGEDLSPSDTALIPKDRLLGIVSRTGGTSSHVAILARNLEIPAVLGIDFSPDTFNGPAEKNAWIDGSEGKLILEPDPKTMLKYEQKTLEHSEKRKSLERLRDVPAIIPNGRRIRLLANIGSSEEIDSVVKFGAEGIGLFRTEFLFMNSPHAPSEEEQFLAYKKVLEAMDGKPVTIRTLDIGGDKPLDYIRIPTETNPFLGLRACRLYRIYPDLILTQIRALYRASLYGNLKIMFPMITAPTEVDEMLSWTEKAKDHLKSRNTDFSDSAEIGIMVETPAAALIADVLLDKVDFCSIGTNDLTQYTLAVDRGNEQLASLYDPLHPAVLRLIRETVKAGTAKGKHVSICGESAGDVSALEQLLETGIDCLSMNPSSIPGIKEAILSFN